MPNIQSSDQSNWFCHEWKNRNKRFSKAIKHKKDFTL